MEPYAMLFLSRELYEERLQQAAQARKMLGASRVQNLPSLLRVLLLIFTS
jgi:hypothetical protein